MQKSTFKIVPEFTLSVNPQLKLYFKNRFRIYLVECFSILFSLYLKVIQREWGRGELLLVDLLPKCLQEEKQGQMQTRVQNQCYSSGEHPKCWSYHQVPPWSAHKKKSRIMSGARTWTRHLQMGLEILRSVLSSKRNVHPGLVRKREVLKNVFSAIYHSAYII